MSEINQTYYTMAKACELLQDELCSHIENIKPLSKNEIESILTLVRSSLDILEQEAYKSYDKLPEMTKHVLEEKDYRRTMLANETKCWENSNHKLVKTSDDYTEHLAWKAKRVKRLQELYPQNNGPYPHNEEWFVKNNLMYDDSIE